MAITDFVKNRSYENEILTIFWSKSGDHSYFLKNKIWVNIESGNYVSDLTNEFLNNQLKMV